MIKGIIRDVGSELLETGKSTVRQAKQVSPGKIVKTASEQVAGSTSTNDPPPGLEDLQGKKVTSSQLSKMKQDDFQKQSQGINSTRVALKKLIIQRYQKLQQDVLQEEKEREQEEVKKQQQQAEELRLKQQEEEKKTASVVIPKGKKKKGGLGLFAKQKIGSRETKLGKMG